MPTPRRLGLSAPISGGRWPIKGNPSQISTTRPQADSVHANACCSTYRSRSKLQACSYVPGCYETHVSL